MFQISQFNLQWFTIVFCWNCLGYDVPSWCHFACILKSEDVGYYRMLARMRETVLFARRGREKGEYKSWKMQVNTQLLSEHKVVSIGLSGVKLLCISLVCAYSCSISSLHLLVIAAHYFSTISNHSMFNPILYLITITKTKRYYLNAYKQ